MIEKGGRSLGGGVQETGGVTGLEHHTGDNCKAGLLTYSLYSGVNKFWYVAKNKRG